MANTRAPGGGRKPVPTNLRVLRGNPGRRPLNSDEPAPKPRLPRAPEHLSQEARKEWSRAGRFLLNLGLISDLDLAAFAAYCQAWGRWVEAEQALKTYGLMLKSPGGFPMQSPYLAVANRAMEQVKGYLSEFGMTPASRTRVQGATPADADPFEDFLNRRPGG